MSASWFATRLARSVEILGSSAAQTLGILSSLPIEAVRRNVAEGLLYAPSRGRDPWKHQIEAMEALRLRLLDEDKEPNAIVVIPTGGGKTDIFTRMVEASGLDAGSSRIAIPTLVLTPTRQLVGQTCETFARRFPALHVRSLGNGDGTPGSVTVATYDLFVDLVREGKLEPGDVASIVMDEAHRGLSDMRQDLIGRFLGRTIISAFSATPAFDANKNIYALLGKDNEVVSIPDARLRRDGVISPVANHVLRVNITGRLPRDGGLRAAIVREATAKAVTRFVTSKADTKIGLALGEKRYFAYANGVDRSAMIAGMLTDAGMPAECVSGRDGMGAITSKLNRLVNGTTRVLVNDQLLVEGTDMPGARGILAFDPTVSTVKHIQRCGRARRIDPMFPVFDHRQTSSIIEVMVEINGRPLRGQKTYAEAIGDMGIAKVYASTSQTVDDIVAEALTEGRTLDSRQEEEAGDTFADALAQASSPGVEEEESVTSPESETKRIDRSRSKMRARIEGFEIHEDVRDVRYLLWRRDHAERPDEYLTRPLAAAALAVGPKNAKLMDMFADIQAALEMGLQPEIDGRPVEAELFVAETGFTHACVHADELGKIRNVLGLPEADEERRDGWLNQSQLASNLGCSLGDGPFVRTWQSALSGELELPPADDGGPGIRPMRVGTKWWTYVHTSSIPVFEQLVDRKARFRFPQREERHLPFNQVCERLGVTISNKSAKRLWKEMADEYAASGSVMDGGRRVGYDIVRMAVGIGPCLDESELEWFKSSSGMKEIASKPDDYLSFAYFSTKTTNNSEALEVLRSIWKELVELAVKGKPLEARGRVWDAGLFRTQAGTRFCMNVSEIPHMWTVLDTSITSKGMRPLTKSATVERTDEWAAYVQAGRHLHRNIERGGIFQQAWAMLHNSYEKTGEASLHGISYRCAVLRSGNQNRFCIHTSDLDALGLATSIKVWESNSEDGKTPDWLSVDETANLFGTTRNDKTLGDAWMRAIRGSEGKLIDGNGSPVGFARRKQRTYKWCLHKDSVDWFSDWSGLRVPTTKSREHIGIVDLRVNGFTKEEIRRLSRIHNALVHLVERGEECALPDGRSVRLDYVKSPTRAYCFHKDDFDLLKDMANDDSVMESMDTDGIQAAPGM